MIDIKNFPNLDLHNVYIGYLHLQQTGTISPECGNSCFYDMVKEYGLINAINILFTEMARRWNEIYKNSVSPLQVDDEIYYVHPDGEIESGIIRSTFYENGILDSFSVDFSTEEWVGFSGLSLGVLCFRTIEEAVQCRKNIHAKNIK